MEGPRAQEPNNSCTAIASILSHTKHFSRNVYRFAGWCRQQGPNHLADVYSMRRAPVLNIASSCLLGTVQPLSYSHIIAAWYADVTYSNGEFTSHLLLSGHVTASHMVIPPGMRGILIIWRHAYVATRKSGVKSAREICYDHLIWGFLHLWTYFLKLSSVNSRCWFSISLSIIRN